MLVVVAAFVLAQTPAVSCDDVRRVHARAVAEGLDDTVLRTLETHVCAQPSSPTPSPNASRACIDLRVLSTLAHTQNAQLPEVDALRNVACSIGVSSSTLTWSTGATARYDNGTWNWPNGATAKDADGSWTWPSGATAKYANGSWTWPNGVTARFTDGTINAPDGTPSTPAQLLAPTCARDPRACRELTKAESVDDDLAMATFLQLVWSAPPSPSAMIAPPMSNAPTINAPQSSSSSSTKR